jgi:hypothetical protein
MLINYIFFLIDIALYIVVIYILFSCIKQIKKLNKRLR